MHAKNAYRGVKASFCSFLTHMQDGDSQLHMPATLLLEKQHPPPTEQKALWAPRHGLGSLEKRRTSKPSQELKHDSLATQPTDSYQLSFHDCYKINHNSVRRASKNDHIILTGSTSHITTVVSFEPVASLKPSGENRQNHTSSQWSLRICIVSHGNCSLYKRDHVHHYKDKTTLERV